MPKSNRLPVAVIGAGPVGLAAAAHLLSRGDTPLLFEYGDGPGHSISTWAHVKLFSPWRYNLDRISVKMLSEHGWKEPPPDELPTGADLITRYLEPLANLPQLKGHIHYRMKVVAIGRKNRDKMKDQDRDNQPFVITVNDREGKQHRYEARAVLDASGTWLSPNPLGAGGTMALGEAAAAEKITYGIPDVKGAHRARYAGKRILVAGSGHSAIQSLLDLIDLAQEAPETKIVWVVRDTRSDRLFGGGEADALPARGALGVRLKRALAEERLVLVKGLWIDRIEQDGPKLTVSGEQGGTYRQLHGIEQIIAATGLRPDFSFLSELRIQLDPSVESTPDLAPLIDPNLHSCGTVRPHGEAELRQPETGLYLLGMKSYGRAPTFLLATGYEQVRSVVAALEGDWESARRVELELPETGVCESDVLEASCCGSNNAAEIETAGIELETEAACCDKQAANPQETCCDKSLPASVDQGCC